MVIDCEKKFILTNYRKVGKTGKAIDSDRFTEFMDLDIEVEAERSERLDIFNFKEEEAQAKFKNLTSDTKYFTNCFDDDAPLLKQISKWRQVLKTYCSEAYKKIRIRKKSIKPIKQAMASLINERNVLSKKVGTPEIIKKIDEVSKRIFEIEAEDNRNKIMKNFKQFSDNPQNINMQQM
jgi:hypothetical protein